LARIGVDRIDLVWRGRHGTVCYGKVRIGKEWQARIGGDSLVPEWSGRHGAAWFVEVWWGLDRQAWFVVDWCGGDRHGGVRQGR
jgi:hypothetical protein